MSKNMTVKIRKSGEKLIKIDQNGQEFDWIDQTNFKIVEKSASATMVHQFQLLSYHQKKKLKKWKMHPFKSDIAYFYSVFDYDFSKWNASRKSRWPEK